MQNRPTAQSRPDNPSGKIPHLTGRCPNCLHQLSKHKHDPGVTIRHNPNVASLSANNHRLLFDGEQWCVNRGVRSIKTVYRHPDYEIALQRWARLAGVDLVPF